MSEKPEIIVRIGHPQPGLDLLAKDFIVHYAPSPEELDKAIADVGSRVRAVVTKGSVGLTAEQIGSLPKLEIVVSRGAGHERIDVAAAKARGIAVTNAAGLNSFAVADHAMAILLSFMRDVPACDAGVHKGDWVGMNKKPARRIIWQKRMGILGLGAIGEGIAKRAAGGFEMTVGYHNRNAKPGVPYHYYAGLVEMAADSDVLMVCCPGGPATRGLVTAEVLKALGPDGVVVNVGRGSVIDNVALAAALRDGTIAGAALDVVDGEPEVPEALLTAPNLVMTPHIGGAANESRTLAGIRVSDNLKAHFAGRPLLDRVA
jgi:lactate dehydrogenase-like 2-hydroxyacid dehydrogenase